MFRINKITSNTTVDFAAEELKKYLRMMMPRRGEIPVSYAPDANESFRLGLMADFGLDMSDAEDELLDDIVYIDADECGGIIAGSNPGALLIAVYRYLRFQDCRWLFPGISGEYIPITDALKPVKYRKKADHRYRGQCNEGAEYQEDMLETIDFTPKIGMNTYMIEFDIPFCYYNRYYTHENNSVREPEPISYEQALQWKRQCEAEIQKRGLHFHDMGHGWTAEPFGISSAKGWASENGDFELSEDTKMHLAMVGGERKLHRGIPLNTNVCMSNPETRRIMANYIAEYAKTQNNVDFLHIWLADDTENHCECEECKKKNASDWYVILLNEIDEELAKRNLNTHLVFIAYTDTFWAPLEEKLANNKRFTMLFAPVTRTYTETYGTAHDPSGLTQFTLNNNSYPVGMGACLAYLDEWKKLWKGDCFCYEYHFWCHETYDPSYMYLARLLYDDIRSQRKNGLSGIVEDGTQRAFFPNGFPYYVYGETLFDAEREYDEIKEDYFTHAYGKDGMKVANYLERLTELLGYKQMSGAAECKVDDISELFQTVEDFAPVIKANKNHPERVRTVAWRLLEHHKDYILGIACATREKLLGNNEKAKDIILKLFDEFSKREVYIERYYDQSLRGYYIKQLFDNPNEKRAVYQENKENLI